MCFAVECDVDLYACVLLERAFARMEMEMLHGCMECVSRKLHRHA